MPRIVSGQAKIQDKSRRCMDAALSQLGYRPRSEAELRQHLTRHSFSREDQDSVIAKLTEDGLINDEIFAQFWSDARSYLHPGSKWATKQDLKQKGIGSELIEQVLATIDEEDNAFRAGLKKAGKLGDIDFETFSRKVGSHLQRRGFSASVIKHALNKVWEDRKNPPPQTGCSCSR